MSEAFTSQGHTCSTYKALDAPDEAAEAPEVYETNQEEPIDMDILVDSYPRGPLAHPYFIFMETTMLGMYRKNMCILYYKKNTHLMSDAKGIKYRLQMRDKKMA